VAGRTDSITVNIAGLVQGIALVTFPAASTILTARGSYDLSSGEYGLMFVPQFIAAIVAALLGAGLLWPGLLARVTEKTVYLTGLAADLAAMTLLVVSWLVVHNHPLAYGLLLVATACLGTGFGLTVPHSRYWPGTRGALDGVVPGVARGEQTRGFGGAPGGAGVGHHRDHVVGEDRVYYLPGRLYRVLLGE
jgi:hypothetical protein